MSAAEPATHSSQKNLHIISETPVTSTQSIHELLKKELNILENTLTHYLSMSKKIELNKHAHFTECRTIPLKWKNTHKQLILLFHFIYHNLHWAWPAFWTVMCPKASLKMFQYFQSDPLEAPENLPILIYQIKSTFLSTLQRKKQHFHSQRSHVCVVWRVGPVWFLVLTANKLGPIPRCSTGSIISTCSHYSCHVSWSGLHIFKRWVSITLAESYVGCRDTCLGSMEARRCLF